MRKTRIILTPVAGAGNGLKALPTIEALLAKNGLQTEIIQSQAVGHAIELARKAALDGNEVIVAVGGDGTVNEVLNGMLQAEQEGSTLPALGVLCVGRGNDFAGSAGIPEDLEGGIQALIANHRKRIDIGRVTGGLVPEGRYFANCVGVGFDAITTIEVKKLPRWGGFLSFLTAVIKTVFLSTHSPLSTLQYDDQELTQRSMMISIMNGRRLGGGFIMAPDSKMDDGFFDLCIAEQMSTGRILRLIPHFMKGTQVNQPGIKMGKAAKIRITGQDGPLVTQTDGEIISIEGRNLEIELLPKKIDVIFRPD
jgi:diacylglycerol kinase (ATP)